MSSTPTPVIHADEQPPLPGRARVTRSGAVFNAAELDEPPLEPESTFVPPVQRAMSDVSDVSDLPREDQPGGASASHDGGASSVDREGGADGGPPPGDGAQERTAPPTHDSGLGALAEVLERVMSMQAQQQANQQAAFEAATRQRAYEQARQADLMERIAEKMSSAPSTNTIIRNLPDSKAGPRKLLLESIPKWPGTTDLPYYCWAEDFTVALVGDEDQPSSSN